MSKYKTFKLIKEEYIKEVEGTGRLFVHQASGAKLIQLQNQDPNKVFSMTFNTPVDNDKGIPHIVEHAVGCASKKYPLLDTFNELDKGSLNICLNACTYKDMTKYYCGSQNEEDFYNLIEVYMDLVFNPLMYSDESIFYQEGWRYEDEEEGYEYNGIVFNEMQGEYCEASTVFEYEMHKTLFDETIYQYDSGGVPSEIIKASGEEVIAYHQKYYTLSNCVFYVYGQAPVDKIMQLIEGLSHEQQINGANDKELLSQVNYGQVVRKEVYYPGGSDNKEDKGIVGISFVVGESKDAQLMLAFDILEHVLLKSMASPLNEYLITKLKLGKSIAHSGFDTLKKQPTFSIVVNGAKSKESEKIEEAMFKMLKEVVEKGIDQKLLEAAFNHVLFGLTEADLSYEPIGVIYSEKIQNSLRYNGDSFSHLKYRDALGELKELANQRYFEKLIKKYILENKHYSVIAVKSKEDINEIDYFPQEPLNNEVTTNIWQKQEAIVESNIVKRMEEGAHILPRIQVNDLNKEEKKYKCEKEFIKGVPIWWLGDNTKGISYVHLMFETSFVKKEELPFLGVLVHLLTYIETKNMSCSELENRINTQTGELNCSLRSYKKYDQNDQYTTYLKISLKCLEQNLTQLDELLNEVVVNTLFEDTDKVREIMEEILYGIERSVGGAPEYVVGKRLYAYVSELGVYEDNIAGISFYKWLKELMQDFDKNKETIAKKLKAIYLKVFTRKQLKIFVTAELSSYTQFKKAMTCLIEHLMDEEYEAHSYKFNKVKSREGFAVATNVQTLGMIFDFKEEGYQYSGVMQVLASIIENMYLWEEVRVKGGAYGCSLSIERDGTIAICSYSDPKATQTLRVFKGIGEFIKHLDLTNQELESYIIGAIGERDIPLSNMQKSELVMSRSIRGLEDISLQKEREEILGTTLQQIKAYSVLFEKGVQRDQYCIVGDQKEIKTIGCNVIQKMFKRF